jgi:hypothetical protein
MTRRIINIDHMADIPYLYLLNGECRENVWSIQGFTKRDEIEQLLVRNQGHFLVVLCRGILGENLELYDWQLDYLKS